MLKWPIRATAAIHKLFKPLQDVDVYVEDVDDEPFYRCLLNYATNNNVNVARVFGLGGRNEVLKAAASHDHSARRALFIIDGDISWVRGEPLPQLDGLHRHDAYCVENLLICEEALTTIVAQDVAVTYDKAHTLLAFGQWRRSIAQPLIELFAAFGTVTEFEPSVQTISQGVGAMCVQHRCPKHTTLDVTKVRCARDRALKAAQEKGADAATITTRYRNLLARISGMPDPLLAVSGKHYLLPLLDFQLQALGCRIKRKSLRIRLACAGDVTRFAKLACALKTAARGARQ